jgi:hypothetical protein
MAFTVPKERLAEAARRIARVVGKGRH